MEGEAAEFLGQIHGARALLSSLTDTPRCRRQHTAFDGVNVRRGNGRSGGTGAEKIRFHPHWSMRFSRTAIEKKELPGGNY